MGALEQSFADITAKHELLSVSVSYLRSANREPEGFYSVNVQWADADRPDGRDIASGSDDGLAEALGGALRLMLAKRHTAVELADEPLQIGEAA